MAAVSPVTTNASTTMQKECSIRVFNFCEVLKMLFVCVGACLYIYIHIYCTITDNYCIGRYNENINTESISGGRKFIN